MLFVRLKKLREISIKKLSVNNLIQSKVLEDSKKIDQSIRY